MVNTVMDFAALLLNDIQLVQHEGPHQEISKLMQRSAELIHLTLSPTVGSFSRNSYSSGLHLGRCRFCSWLCYWLYGKVS